MSTSLKELMAERANAATPPQLDVDAITKAGDARVRGRRIMDGDGSAAAVLALSFGGSTLLDVRSDPGPQQLRPATPAFADRLVTYAVGSTIFYGDERFDVAPYRVSKFVQTDDGFVFTDKAGDILFTDGQETTKIGSTDQPYGALAGGR